MTETQTKIHNIIASRDSIDEQGDKKTVNDLLKLKDEPDAFEALAWEIVKLHSEIWNQSRKRIVFSKPK